MWCDGFFFDINNKLSSRNDGSTYNDTAVCTVQQASSLVTDNKYIFNFNIIV